MTPKKILLMDRTLGRLACTILSLWNRVSRCIMPVRYERPKRILFVKLIEMGSSVLACPAFEEAVARVGRENIFIILFAPNRPIIDLLPFFPPENVLAIDDSSLVTFIPGLLRTLRRVRLENIDTAIDMEGLTRSSAVITYLTGARNRVGYYNFHSEGPYRGRLFTHELSYNFQHHVSAMFLALVQSSFCEPGDVPLLKEPIEQRPLPTFESSDEDTRKVREMLDGLTGGRRSGPLVLLNPNCSDLMPLRRWPEEKMIELGQRILSEISGSTVAITGARSEQPAAELIARQISADGRTICVAGHTSLRELLALYHVADVLISNDSGPCHFASLTPIPVISLFGPETPQLYGPLGEGKTSLSANLACSPCVNMLNHRFSPCTDNQCMKRIPVDQVFDALTDALSRR
ncbi:MAG: glycosyltransferase family 9 protein [Verrucomicrobia bacterium]|nr:glycosyltransferase family 9 protein [Verrucomicrobiota bacterium]